MREIEKKCFKNLKYLLKEPLPFDILLEMVYSDIEKDNLIQSIENAYEEGLIIIEGFNEDSFVEMWDHEYKGKISLTQRSLWIVDKFIKKNHTNPLDIQLVSELKQYREV